MKFLLKVVLIVFLTAIFQLFTPFWIVAVVAFVVGMLFSERPRKWTFSRRKKSRPLSFLAGFLAIFLLWGGLAYSLDQSNASILSTKIAGLMLGERGQSLSDGMATQFIILLTALMGGLWAGFACMAGNAFGELVKS